ncbi:hypothetical protein SAMN06295912_10649 [Sphingomonas laterariae]|uniref:Uncharacterized protein n=1 Tax=Edaphosphingomonas laterariae TaxID=861865 RepID=A0A239EB17_9SPHN|nr:hypothetical protein SAMN06295912_10649 [Sphingomonas laterariae]
MVGFSPSTVIPAKAGSHIGERCDSIESAWVMDPRLRRDDEKLVAKGVAA